MKDSHGLHQLGSFGDGGAGGYLELNGAVLAAHTGLQGQRLAVENSYVRLQNQRNTLVEFVNQSR